MNKKGDLAFMILPIALCLFIIAMMLIVWGDLQEELKIAKLDKNCYKTEKQMYCKSIGMELGSIVLTPGGFFGGSPYNKEACVSENSEKIIELEDLNYERCLPK